MGGVAGRAVGIVVAALCLCSCSGSHHSAAPTTTRAATTTTTTVVPTSAARVIDIDAVRSLVDDMQHTQSLIASDVPDGEPRVAALGTDCTTLSTQNLDLARLVHDGDPGLDKVITWSTAIEGGVLACQTGDYITMFTDLNKGDDVYIAVKAELDTYVG